jgi:hypothetical protein
MAYDPTTALAEKYVVGSGVDVMSPIFRDFRQYLAEKMEFFFKINGMSPVMQRLGGSILNKKRQFFSPNVSAKFF